MAHRPPPNKPDPVADILVRVRQLTDADRKRLMEALMRWPASLLPGYAVVPVKVLETMIKVFQSVIGQFKEHLVLSSKTKAEMLDDLGVFAEKLWRIIPKPRNTERDAEILRLRAIGKSQGQIVRALRLRGYSVTVGAVKQVLHRQKKEK